MIILHEDDYPDSDLYAFVILFYFLLLFLVIARWIFAQARLIIQLKNEKAKTEMMHLQSQVNPHFFFNILNSLYGWIDKDPKQAQALILKLSDMMRYSIYDGQKEFVLLEDEIEYLKNYMALHKMRYHKEIDLTFEVDVPQSGLRIRPLLFIILLENAFKHGVENLKSDAFIHIRLSAKGDDLSFSIENNFDPEEENSEVGIGLKNLQRRLELVYPQKHHLHLSTTNTIYQAQLTLNLK